MIVGRGPLADRVYDTMRRAPDCARARLVAPQHALARICDERPDHALFCGPDRASVLAAIRDLVVALPDPPATSFALVETTAFGGLALAEPAGA